MVEEETSMKRSRSLIILAAVLVLLTGTYVYLTHSKKSATAGSSSTEVLKLDTTKIKSITLKSKSTVAIEKKDGSWQLSENPGIKLDDTAISNVLHSICNLNATSVISDAGSNLSQYGLQDSPSEAAAVLDDGTQKTVLIGNKTPDGTGYYMMLKGGSKVYMIQSTDGDYLRYSLTDIRDKNISSINVSYINYIKVSPKDGKVFEAETVAKGSSAAQYIDEGSWAVVKPYSIPQVIDETKLQNITDGITNLKIDDFVEDNAKDLSKYGLDKPVLEFLARDSSGQSIDLFFGKKKDDSHIYFMKSGSKSIYTADTDVFNDFNVKPGDMITKSIFLKNIDDVDTIAVESSGKQYLLAITRTSKKNGDSTATTAAYTINGKTVSENDFKNLYADIVGLTTESENDKNIAEKPDIKFTFNLNTGVKKHYTVTYCPYNSDFYAVFVDGKSDFLISRTQVQKVIDSINTILKK